MFAVIVENDESQWADETGAVYHFPKRYQPLLRADTHVVYYKGRLRNPKFAAHRLTSEPHYFGVARIGKVFVDRQSKKGDVFATIDDYQRLTPWVPIRDREGHYFEPIPANRSTNYWRDGVRSIDESVYGRILAQSSLSPANSLPQHADQVQEEALESWHEGSRSLRYVTVYERDKRYRRQAIEIHGYRCAVCELSMGDLYGNAGEGLIHIHHVVPVSTYAQPKTIDPEKDLVPVCPNCHAVIHRRKDATLSIAEARAFYKKPKASE